MADARPAQKDAYELILEAIDRGEYRPGDRLVESDLAERFKVSRTPIREALQRLETQSMLTRQGRSLIVASLDHNQLSELLASHNRFLVQQLDLVHRSMALLATTSLAAEGRGATALDEHAAIVQAIAAGDGAAAAEALRTHLSNAFETRLRLDAGTARRVGAAS